MNISSVMAALAMVLHALFSVFIPKKIKAKIKKRKDDCEMENYKLRLAVAKRYRKDSIRTERS